SIQDTPAAATFVPGFSLTTTRTFTVTVGAVNDPPLVLLSNTSFAGTEDTALLLGGVRVSDPDAGGGSMRLALAATNGFVAFGDTTGLTFQNGTANRQTNIIVTGSLAALNSALSTLNYLGFRDVFGQDRLNILIDDQGNTGTGGAKQDAKTLNLNLAAVNDPPFIERVTAQTLGANATLNVRVKVTDVDSPTNMLSLTAGTADPDVIAPPLVFRDPTDPSFWIVQLTSVGPLRTTSISLLATDGLANTTTSFVVTVQTTNVLPAFSGLPSVIVLPEDTSTNLNFVVADLETLASGLNVQVFSSNPALFPAAGMATGGSGSARSLLLVPATNQFGAASLSLVLSDGAASVTNRIEVTVTPVNDLPVLGAIADLSVPLGVTTNAVFAVQDVETSTSALAISVKSSVPTIVANDPLVGIDGLNRSIRIAPLGVPGTTEMTVIVTDENGGAATNWFRVSVIDPLPLITQHPTNVVAVSGSTAFFTVVATGQPPLTYQWKYRGADLGGATNSILTLQGVTNSLAGAYSVAVSNAFGGKLSNPAELSVVTPPIFLVHPESQSIRAGATVSLFGSAAGSPPIAYQWLFENQPISDATNNNLVLPNVMAGRAGRYTLRASNLAGSASSREAVITVNVNTPPTITDIPNPPPLLEGTVAGPYSFTVLDNETPVGLVVVGNSSNPTLLPNEAILIEGGNGPFRRITLRPAAGQTGSSTITVTVRDPDGATASDTFVLTVIRANTPPSIQDIQDRQTEVNVKTPPIVFTIRDAETAAAELRVSKLSSNPSLVPDENIVLGGNGSFRSVQIEPAPNQAGQATITLTVSDGELSASDSFVLTVVRPLVPPAIVQQPVASLTTNVGATVLLSVAANGSDPLAFQWRFNTNPISGATSSNLVLTNVQVAQSGRYSVQISNPAGSVTSSESILTVVAENLPPAINLLQPTNNASFTAGEPIILTAAANDPDGLVTKVAFFAGNTLVGEDASSPYNAIATNLPPGDYRITAVATDNEGLAATSAAANIKIEQPKNLPAISITDSGGLEGNAGFRTFTFNLTLSALSADVVTVQYSTFGDTATGGSDFVESRGEVRFDRNIRTRSIQIQVIGDTVPDGDNETFFVNLSSPVNAILADSQGIGTIQDDEDPVFISISDAGVTEGNSGTNRLAFVVLLSDPSPQKVSVEFNTVNGSAVAGRDFVARAGRLVFPPLTTRLEILVPVIPDLIQEPDKQLTLRLSNPANAILFPGEEEGLGTITDDDIPPVARVENLTLPEGNAGSTEAKVVVTLTSPSAQKITLDFTTADGSAKSADGDYTPVQGVVTFEPGVTSQTITVPVTADTIHEPDENFLFRLSNPTSTTIARAEATITIRNDDLLPTLSVVGRNIIEGNSGPTHVDVTVLLSTPSGQVVTVDFGTRDATALAGSDYVRNSGTLVFQPGETTKLVTIRVLGDLIDESRETFELLLDRAVNAEINEGTAIVAILDDDVAPSLAIADAALPEGNSGSTEALFTVTLSAASGQTVTVSFSTESDSAKAGEDFIAASGSLTFAPGQTSKSIGIPVLGDIVNEPDEQFRVVLASPSNAAIARTNAVGTILNDDDAPKIRAEDLETDEGNAGLLPANITIRLTSGSSQRVTVRYETANGTALSGEDYLPTSGQIVFEPGETEKSVVLQIAGDTSDESNETLRFKLSAPVNAEIERAESTVTILDDDLAPTLSIVGRNVLEGNTGFTNAVFTVLLSTPSGQPVSVDYESFDVSATAGIDYTAVKGELVFQPGETSKTIPVPVRGDLVDEPRETFQVKLSSPVGATINEDTATGAILDDDVAPTLTIRDASATEGHSGQSTVSLTVSLSNASGQPVTVTFSTADGTAQANSDYVTNEGLLTFNPGQSSLTIPVALIADRVNEATETFTVTLASPTNATLARAQATITILDDDDVPTLPPILNAIPNQSGQINAPVEVALVVRDPDTPIAQVQLSATSDQTTVLAASGLRFSGEGESRILTLTPNPDQTGTTTITVTASDGRHTATRTFRYTVSVPNTPPTILTQPQSRVVLVGTSVSFSVSAAGSPPLRFQWNFNGVNLPQGTNAILSLDAVQSSQSGGYSVTVSNSAGSATSAKATLIVGRLGAKLWDFTVGRPIRTSVAMAANGTLYFGADDRKVYALRPDGTLKWSFTTGGELYSSPAIAPDGTILIGSFDGKVYALDPEGNKKWEFATGAEIYSTPAISASGDVFIGSYDFKVYALSKDGAKKWEFVTGNTIASSPSIGSDGTIYIGSQDRKLYALNPDGTKKWEFATGADIISSPTLGADGAIYFGSLDRRLYALNSDGTRRWSFTALNAIRSSPTLGEDGTLYFGTDDGRLYAVDSTGRRKWDVTTGVLIFSSPAVGVDGTIYVGSFDRKLYAFNPNGSRRWEFATEGEVYSSPALDKDGVVYLGSLDGKVYAIKGTTGLADTPWPMFRRSLDHAGRAAGGAVAAAPQFQSPEIQTDLVLRLPFASAAGVTYQLEVSSDLANWTVLRTLTATSAVSEFFDTLIGGTRARFYRIAAKP
ncbi:MAG: hypothetical protein FJ404_12635, partial [Verrucomicrobia bacterium]|nr:hypothetical protein [Verrucomicrobiota bacterium]